MNKLSRHLKNTPATARQAVIWPQYVCLLCFALLFIRFPGEWDSDTLAQQSQMLARSYTDWHPPVFTAFWGFLNRFWNGLTGMNYQGSALLFIAHAAAFWGGIALLLRAAEKFWLSFAGKALWRLCLVLALLFLGGVFELVPMGRFIFKDTAMISAYTLALGLLCNFPRSGLKKNLYFTLCIIALFYGTAARHNSIFALLPLLAALIVKAFGVKEIWKILLCSVLLWAAVLGTIKFVETQGLETKKEYSIQEIYYGDIWKINYKTKRFVAPPPVNGEGWESLDPKTFYNFYDNDPYIMTAFRYINKALPEPVKLYRDFSADPSELDVLRQAWLDRIYAAPSAYFGIRKKLFSTLMESFSFCGLNGSIYLLYGLLASIAMFPALRSSRGRDKKHLTPYLICLSGLFYALPYYLVLPAMQRRYLFWFYLASAFSAVWFGGRRFLHRKYGAPE